MRISISGKSTDSKLPVISKKTNALLVKYSMKQIFSVCSLFVLLLCVHDVSATQLGLLRSSDTSKSAEGQERLDLLGRATPRSTVKGFYKALMNGNYSKAQRYLEIDDGMKRGRQPDTLLVQRFEAFLNQGGNIAPINLISNNINGDLDDGLDPILDEIGKIRWEGEVIPIYLEKSINQEQQTVWLFSWETVSRIPPDFTIQNENFVDRIFSSEATQKKWRGAPISHWVSIVLMAIAAYMIAWLFTILFRWVIRLFWPSFRQGKNTNLLKTFLVPLRIVIAVALFVWVSREAEISMMARNSFSIINLSVLWIALFLFIWLLIGTLAGYSENRLRERNNVAGLSVTLFLRNSAKFILIILAFIMILDTFGVNVTAGLAALGIGGIALALGAQKTIENLVGSITVIFDQPVRVGDFCRFGSTMGTVESIGMRSTRIRTLDRTLITIPNGDFASQHIENFSLRDTFLYRKTIGLRFETTSDQMRYILVGLRKLLYAHPKVDPDPARVRFLEYGSDSLNVELFAYILAEDYNEFLAIQEDINLRLAEVVEESGSGFAFPSQTVYLSRDKGLSDAKTKEAEEVVRKWIEEKELELPEFDQATIDKLKETLKYPPEGSKQS